MITLICLWAVATVWVAVIVFTGTKRIKEA